MKVAFFQRIFAHYQSGLVKELARGSPHAYRFFSDTCDPMSSGIEPLPADLRDQIPFTACRTTHFSLRLAFQWRAVWEALFGQFDAFIFEGSLTMPTNWLALLAAKARRKQVFFYTHGWRQPDGFWKKLLRCGLYRPADGLLLYGLRAVRLGLRAGFPAGKLHVVYNCLNDQDIRIQSARVSEIQCQAFRRECFGPDAARPMVVAVGRLVAAKRLALVIEAVGLLMQDGLNVNLVFVGDGPERETLAALAKATGVHLTFTGARHDESFLAVVFASADLSVISGAAGLSVIHSLSYGTPVVVHGNESVQGPETEAVEAGHNGAVFLEGDVGDLARNIGRVLRELPRGQLTAARCRHVIDTNYNPVSMRKVFDRAISGEPAPDSSQAVSGRGRMGVISDRQII